MRTLDLGEAVGPGVPTGGTANQVLVKNGSTNFDTSWKEASQLPAISDEAAAREAADAALADGLAIVANGNTHAAITSGQYVYVKNHSSLAEGLYKATAAIGTNAALSTSNLTADSQGGLNALKASVDTLNSNLTLKEENLTFTYNGKTIDIYFRYNKSFLCVLMSKENESMALPTSWSNVGTLTNIRPPSDRYIPFISANGKTGTFRIYPDGGVRMIAHSSDVMWLQTCATCSL